MSATTTKKLLSAEEFAKLPNPSDGSRQELVRGEVITVPPPRVVHGLVQVNVVFALKTYARQTKSGRITAESGVTTEEDPDTVRGPDVAFWSYKQLPADQIPAAYPTVAPDLCVEVRSPSNTAQKLTRKLREYFARGVRMVWIVDPAERTVKIYRQPGDGRVLWEDATITGDDVLPDFAWSIAEFFQLVQ